MTLNIFKTLILIFSLSYVSPYNAQAAKKTPSQLVKEFDESFYNPKDHGLKDLVFDVRIPGLTKQLAQKSIYGKLKDVFFRCYWTSKGKVFVEVKGMPEGFEQVKSGLIGMVHSRFDLVVPYPLFSRLDGYKLKILKQQDGAQLVQALDKSGLKMINEIYLTFDKEGKLVKLKTIDPLGHDISILKLSKEKFSKEKYIVDKVLVNSVKRNQEATMQNEVTYKEFDGFALPIVFISKTKQSLPQPHGGKEKYERELKSRLEFGNYKINKDLAKKYFSTQKK